MLSFILNDRRRYYFLTKTNNKKKSQLHFSKEVNKRGKKVKNYPRYKVFCLFSIEGEKILGKMG